jgi:hypothetical protein
MSNLIIPMRPRRLRRLLAATAVGAVLAAVGLTQCAPPAAAYPACGFGVPSVSTPWGGFCDSQPDGVGRHYHCQWGMGFELCEYRWADNTPAPAPGFVA